MDGRFDRLGGHGGVDAFVEKIRPLEGDTGGAVELEMDLLIRVKLDGLREALTPKRGVKFLRGDLEEAAAPRS